MRGRRLRAANLLVWGGSPVVLLPEVRVGAESTFFLPRNRRKWRAARWRGRGDSEKTIVRSPRM